MLEAQLEALSIRNCKSSDEKPAAPFRVRRKPTSTAAAKVLLPPIRMIMNLNLKDFPNLNLNIDITTKELLWHVNMKKVNLMHSLPAMSLTGPVMIENYDSWPRADAQKGC